MAANAEVVRQFHVVLRKFEELNYRALRQAFALSEHANDIIRLGRNYPPREYLLNKYSDLIATLISMVVCYKKIIITNGTYVRHKDFLEQFIQKLDSLHLYAWLPVIEQLHFLFLEGYQRPRQAIVEAPIDYLFDTYYINPTLKTPFDNLRGLIGAKSKPIVYPHNIETVEEFIRSLHEEIINAYGIKLKDISQTGENIATINRSPLFYIGKGQPPKNLKSKPIWQAFNAVEAFYSLKDEDNCLRLAVISKNILSMHFKMGAHYASITIIYDKTANKFILNWIMAEPGNSYARATYCEELFAGMGFVHKGSFLHSATKRVGLEGLEEGVKFMLFVAYNVGDLDLNFSGLEEDEGVPQIGYPAEYLIKMFKEGKMHP